MSVARGLRFCADLRLFCRSADFVDLGVQAAPNRSRRCDTGGLDRAPGTLARRSAAASAGTEALLGERGQRGRSRDGDQLGDEWALEELDEGLARGIRGAPAPFTAAATLAWGLLRNAFGFGCRFLRHCLVSRRLSMLNSSARRGIRVNRLAVLTL